MLRLIFVERHDIDAGIGDSQPGVPRRHAPFAKFGDDFG